MSMIEHVWAKARANQKTIVLPEGEEPRTVQAASKVRDEGLAKPVLLGNPDRIRAIAESTETDITGIRLIDPSVSPNAREYGDTLFKLRRAKGLSREEAAAMALNPMYYGMLMVKTEDADGLVSGAVHSTGDMLRPALQIIKTKPGINIVSSSFLMNCPNHSLGQDGLLVYADCVVVPCPTAEELAQIAVSAADTARVLCGIIEPRVALLSFSTKGSGNDAKFYDTVTKVQQATAKAKELAPELKIDGEYQFDAAIVPKVAKIKAPDSEIAGQANVFVFPDINAGNIGYKIAERLGGFIAVGPICQGFAKPLNDLSRGCSTDDIVLTVAVTALQAGAQK